MALRHWFILGAAFGVMTAVTPARAQAPATPPSQPAAPSGPVYTVTYFDVAPAASRSVGSLLRQFDATTRKEAGNLEFLALHEIARPGRYAILEGWRDAAARDAHGAAMKGLAGKLQANYASPFDPRQFLALSVAAPATGTAARGVIYVLTHVDVFPAGKDQAAALVKQQVEDSRKDAGALRYDALVWDGHPNHFHLIEAWASRAARDAHALADHSRAFRAKLLPFEGAFYDERLYEALR